MTRSFHSCDRDQLMFLPPSILDWIPENDLSRFIVESVAQFSLEAFYAKIKDGSGQKAYRPEVLVSLLILAYCNGIRSSRMIERLCIHDIRFRMITCNQMPDHTTIARFRSGHRKGLQELFVDVLRLCAQAGLGKVGVVSIDGTKIKANAAMQANRTREQLSALVQDMFDEAESTDAGEDAQLGADCRGDELPEDLRSASSRQAKLRAAKQQLDRLDKAYAKADAKSRKQIHKYDDAIERQKARQAETGKKPAGHVVKPPTQDQLNKPKANLTDPDSGTMKGSNAGYMQGHNAQAAVTADQIIVAQMVSGETNDMTLLAPMVNQLRQSLESAGVKHSPGAILADAGYWTPESIAGAHGNTQLFAQQPPELIVAVPRRWRKLKQPPCDDTPPPEATSLEERIEHRQRSPGGQVLYKHRAVSVEPVFGQIKNVMKFDRFTLRGTDKVNAEWALICSTHNLMKLWRAHCTRN